jgi:N-acetylglutamate synthase-like GNAT family acetyltransferase
MGLLPDERTQANQILELVRQTRTPEKGIGRALFEMTKDWAKGIGATWFEWYASQSATGFYKRLGFTGDAQPNPENPYYEIDFSKS